MSEEQGIAPAPEGVRTAHAESCGGEQDDGRIWAASITRWELGRWYWYTGVLARLDRGQWVYAEPLLRSPSLESPRAVLLWCAAYVRTAHSWPWYRASAGHQ